MNFQNSDLILKIKKAVLVIIMYNCFYLISCRKFIKVEAPVTSINGNNVYDNDATAIATVNAIYTKMSGANFNNGGIVSTSLFAGLSADELSLFNLSNDIYRQYYQNSLNSTNALTSDFWYQTYPLVFLSNAAIEGLNASNKLSSPVKQQLLGEAKFLRAFFYFYLTNLYGDIPLILGTDWKVNSIVAKTSKQKVYEQIITDLKESQNLLNEKFTKADAMSIYNVGQEERVRPTKWAASALLSRAYLYVEDWANAEVQANSVIGNSVLFDTVSINNVFLKNSKEAIWQLQPVLTGYNTQEGRLFILPSTGPSTVSNYPVYLSDTLVKSFENGDQRKINWVGKTDPLQSNNITYYYPSKYKIFANGAALSEYTMILRLAEQYLIRSEARTQQTNFGDAVSDLNVIRKRAGLPNLSLNDKDSLLAAILHERQIELFTEWGHRWLDLKRTKSVDQVMSAVTPKKGGTWETTDQLYPIPSLELQRNPSLVQNPGY